MPYAFALTVAQTHSILPVAEDWLKTAHFGLSVSHLSTPATGVYGEREAILEHVRGGALFSNTLVRYVYKSHADR